MERLTKRSELPDMDGHYTLNALCADDCSHYCDWQESCHECMIQKTLDQLAAYENTGFSPEEIATQHHLVLALISKERQRQNDKFGDQSGNQPFEWISILGEEFGELCEAVNETCFKNGVHPERGGLDKMLKEAIHVAAVATAFAEAIIYNQEGTDETARKI